MDSFTEAPHITVPPTPAKTASLPLAALITLSTIGFVTMLTETVPAGLLGSIGASLGASDSATGQLLTVYAAGSMVAAIPLTALTRGWPRKPLLLYTMIGVAAANAVTAVSTDLYLAAGARILGGVCAGVQWAMIAGYAMRMVDEQRKGKALAVAMAGIPLALAFGLPVGTFLGQAIGWRGVFGVLTALGLAAALAALALLPQFTGESANARQKFSTVLLRPGLGLIVLGALAFQAAHMNLYTYVEPYLGPADLSSHVGVVLLCLGIAAMAGLWLAGSLIDRSLPLVGIGTLVLFTLSMVLLGTWNSLPPVIFVAVILWGLALGAAPTMFQAACARAAGDAIDLAQSVLVTLFNAGMALGSLIGGVTLHLSGNATALPWVSCAIFAATLTMLAANRKRALPGAPSVASA